MKANKSKYVPGDVVSCHFGGRIVKATVCKSGESPPLKIHGRRPEKPILCCTNTLFWINEQDVIDYLGKDYWKEYYDSDKTRNKIDQTEVSDPPDTSKEA